MFATSISYRPYFRFSPSVTPRSKFLKPISFHYFRTSEEPFVFNTGCGSVLRTTLDEKNRVLGTKTMTEMIRTSASRSSDGDELLEITENEAILSNGSLEFGREIVMSGGGLEWTLNRLSKWLVAALFGIVVIWRHDAGTMWAATGAVLNAWLSITLKRILNQERPISTLRSDPGMPSSHAQSIFFAVIFAILSLVKSVGFNEVTVTIGVLALALSSYLSWLRVSQQLHTISQVVVGAILGTVCSILWFQSWHVFVLKAFVSFLWVRIVVVLGAATFCLSFLLQSTVVAINVSREYTDADESYFMSPGSTSNLPH
ncbi:Phosphatidic acid phosphatase type 2/haloperoxidase [Macleaya cordata]|uniref:Phosphatidic acid phosphatase type 2/haloperoxidase n=1 Tax=Macleaya cordata TaxID=56857 RepID=A0A200QE88_MACCD|nr:Phosphatidic acid phosphatase type 2/haloperoxidase [Macleaya cordata]